MTDDGDRPKVAVITMARDEAGMLPRWVDYYGGQVGRDNLLVLDDNSTDGSAVGLGCTVQRLPPPPWRESWGKARLNLVNGLARGYLACYDVVVFTDVDEFLVPDPARYDGLRDYFARREGQPVMAALGLNVVHAPDVEPALDPDRPLLSQRRFVKFAPNMCKPLAKRVPASWTQAFHGIRSPYEVDRELWLLHLKFHDIEALRTVAGQRQELFLRSGRGDKASTWPVAAEDLVARQLGWVENADLTATPELDPGEPDLSKVVQPRSRGFYRSSGTQLGAMDHSPLRRLPARVSMVF